MKFLDSTVNQHYLSQVEQRLNACNPNALHSNQKIYSFEILKRGNSDEIKLGDPEGKKIKVNLALDDLFTFDVEPKANLRQNLEALFQRYEQNVHICTESLLKKIEAKSGDISEDLISLFSAKLLNFIRNPNSIPKILDTFRGIVNFRPTNPEHDALFQAVLHGRKPQQYARCKELQISDIQYREWLGMLFMLLNPLGTDKENIFDQTIRNMFTNKKFCVFVLIGVYSKQKCLLSDRSFSTSIQNAQIDGIDFNLRDNAFIRYVFGERIAFLPKDTPPDLLAMSENLPNIHVGYSIDDISLLRGFNLNVINQSHSRVFCAAKENIVF